MKTAIFSILLLVASVTKADGLVEIPNFGNFVVEFNSSWNSWRSGPPPYAVEIFQSGQMHMFVRQYDLSQNIVGYGYYMRPSFFGSYSPIELQGLAPTWGNPTVVNTPEPVSLAFVAFILTIFLLKGRNCNENRR